MTWEYLAGFTDGDGCITLEFAKGKYRFSRLRWAQKVSESYVLQRICEFLTSQGIKITSRNFSVAVRGHKYPQAELGITNAGDTYRACVEMLPFLTVKRERAQQVVEAYGYILELKARHGNKYRRYMTEEESGRLAEMSAAGRKG